MSEKKSPPAHHKAIYRHMAAAVPGEWRVREYINDDDPEMVLPIARCEGAPVAGAVLYSTLGLSDHLAMSMTGVRGKRFEICMVGSAQNKSIPNVLATMAFFAMQGVGEGTFAPGVIRQKAIAKPYYTRAKAGHLLLTKSPVFGVEIPRLAGKQPIEWLYAAPVTSDEFLWAQKQGSGELESLLMKHRPKLTDLARTSVQGI